MHYQNYCNTINCVKSLQVSPIFSSLQVGEPVTISVYFRDDTLKYDATVKECWASDIEDYETAKQKIKITKYA